MIFEHPEYLLGLLIVPAAALFFLWANKQRDKTLAKMGQSSLLKRLSTSINWRGRRWRNTLLLAALALFIFALARPQWGSEMREVKQEGLQVMVALDVSTPHGLHRGSLFNELHLPLLREWELRPHTPAYEAGHLLVVHPA